MATDDLAERLLTRALVEQPDRHALFLDVDGTLLDIAATPGAVVVPDALPAILAGLSRTLTGALALVSGRQIDELDQFFSPVRVPAAGAHGAQLRFEATLIPGDRARQLADDLRAALFDLAGKDSRLLVEDKGTSVAVHYRNAPEHERALRQAISKLIGHNSGDKSNAPRLLEGKMLFEVKSSGFDKGTALDQFMERDPFAGRKPVVIGDDYTDEFAFARAVSHGGLCFGVGKPMNGVAAIFESPEQVRRVLALILQRAMLEM